VALDLNGTYRSGLIPHLSTAYWTTGARHSVFRCHPAVNHREAHSKLPPEPFVPIPSAPSSSGESERFLLAEGVSKEFTNSDGWVACGSRTAFLRVTGPTEIGFLSRSVLAWTGYVPFYSLCTLPVDQRMAVLGVQERIFGLTTRKSEG
jgi:hypothetical protein